MRAAIKVPLYAASDGTEKRAEIAMTESLIKREHHSEITKSKVSRQKIIDAALKEFGQHGYEGASTNQICLSAGISKGLLYHYFKSKENLFLAVCDQCLQDQEEALSFGNLPYRVITTGELFAFFRKQADFYSAHPNHYHILSQIATSGRSEVLEGFVSEKRRRYREQGSVAMRLFLSRSPVRPEIDKELALELIMGITDNIQSRYLDMIFRQQISIDMALDTLEKGLQAAIDIILHGILQPGYDEGDKRE